MQVGSCFASALALVSCCRSLHISRRRLVLWRSISVPGL